MEYTILIFLFYFFELLYFKLADKYNIIDKPNNRSSHTQITLRGGGVVFYFGSLVYFIISNMAWPYFFLGLTLISLISFLDDLYTISSKIRLSVHILSVFLLFYEIELFQFPIWVLIIALIITIGAINAYNFMDGINGMTGSYSLSILLLLSIANFEYSFIDGDVINYTIIAILVFMFFNFRNKAKCFAGDIGSVSIAFIIIFIILTLILKTKNIIYILFLILYGIDTVITIIQRLLKKENIFQAHRSHLYQYLSNEVGYNKLLVSFFYGLIQFIIGIIILKVDNLNNDIQLYFSVFVLFFSSLIYLIVKRIITKKYVANQ